jgi:antitoxin component of MazEF toxin-antitoxin module
VVLRKVRKDGNSLVVTIPVEEAVKARLRAGDYVQIETDKATGGVLILPVQVRRRPDFVEIGSRVIEEDRALLDRLAE